MQQGDALGKRVSEIGEHRHLTAHSLRAAKISKVRGYKDEPTQIVGRARPPTALHCRGRTASEVTLGDPLDRNVTAETVGKRMACTVLR